MKRAWRVTAAGTTVVVAADRRSRAVQLCHRAANEAGYVVDWQDVRAIRAPEHDAWATTDPGTRCWDEEYLPEATP